MFDCGTFSPPTGYKVISCNNHKYGDVCDLSCATPEYDGDVDDPVCGLDGWTRPSGCSRMQLYVSCDV